MAGVNTSNLRQIICSNVSIEYETSGSIDIFTKKWILLCVQASVRTHTHTHTHTRKFINKYYRYLRIITQGKNRK